MRKMFSKNQIETLSQGVAKTQVESMRQNGELHYKGETIEQDFIVEEDGQINYQLSETNTNLVKKYRLVDCIINYDNNIFFKGLMCIDSIITNFTFYDDSMNELTTINYDDSNGMFEINRFGDYVSNGDSVKIIIIPIL